jgi:hypothetical protein
MIPKEKAEELFEKFNKEGLHQISSLVNRFIRKEMIKQCALILVEEILEVKPSKKYWDTYSDETPSAITYWEEVKTEINNL